ncbi:MAG: hypothetical protein COA78_15775 [Blastopirellula sp.]|nr:MAG: hypothetical protein COA78_15775 [Blastopirellula sp.]
MSNLRNPDIRTRDIRKLVGYKSQEIAWDQGCDETSEWVMASLEDEAHVKTLINWLSSKNIPLESEAVLIDSGWKRPKRVCWGDLISDPRKYFGKDMFQLYDLDLNWTMEYQVQEIARFGRYGVVQNA